MHIGIHPDLRKDENFTAKWTEHLREHGVTVITLDLLAPDALEQASRCDGVMWRWRHNPTDKQSAQRILYTIEHLLGIPVFPNSRTAWHYDEKVAQHYVLQALHAPVPETSVFWRERDALAWAATATFPVIFKLSAGAGSSNVLKVESVDEARALIWRAFERGIFPMTMNEYRTPASLPRTRAQCMAWLRRVKDALRYVLKGEYPQLPDFWWKPERNYVYFQEYLPDNAFDTRVTVIGDRAFAFRRMNRPGDYRASGSGLLEYDPAEIDLRCIELAFSLSQAGEFQTMAYDFMYRQGAPVVIEISYAFSDAAVAACPGHWDRQLRWVEGAMWPEEAQIDVFLAQIRS